MARVPYVARKDLPESQRYIYDEIAGKRGRTAVGNGFGALLNSPLAASKVSALGAYLRFESEVPATIRELLILTVAREFNCEYEWALHEDLARKAGVSEAIVVAIHERRAPQGLPPDEAGIVRYAHELLRNRHVSDDAFGIVLNQLGIRGLIDVTLIISYYAMLALAFLALKVEP